MELEKARKLLISTLNLHDYEMQEAIRTVLLATNKENLRIEYDKDSKYAHFNGHTYCRDNNGYYKRNAQLHVDVYEYFNGTVPEGYEVHHNAQDENGNFDNSKNDIEYLLMMNKTKHNELHNLVKVIRQCQRCGRDFETAKRSRAKHCKECRRLIKNEQERNRNRDRREYNKKYYEEHKDSLNRKRTERRRRQDD